MCTEVSKIEPTSLDKTYNAIESNIKVTVDEFHYAYAVVFTRYIGYTLPKSTPDWFGVRVSHSA